MAIQNIDYYIEEVKKGHIDGGERRTKAYIFKEDNVILVQKYQKNFAELKERIKKCKMLGINIPAYIDYKIDNDKRGWILQELAKGKEFASLVNNENGTNIIANIPYEHIENYLRDVYLLNANGIGVEPRRRNIFYDETVGFTTIDVAALDLTKDSDSLENDKNLNEKNTSKVLRAFEKSHPFFGKYKRWIYK